MQPSMAFRGTPKAKNIAFARSRAFGILAVNDAVSPLLSHVPFLLDQDGTAADLHLVRSNPIAHLENGPAVIAVSGPDGYISPDWYEVQDQVPTWNYVAVHLRGQLIRRPQAEMRDLLDRQSAFYEARLAPKPAWFPDKMTADVLNKLMRSILPYRLEIEEINGTWKLGQNKGEAARLAATGQVATGFGAELSALEALMREG